MANVLYLYYKPFVQKPFYCGIGCPARPRQHLLACNLKRNTLFYNTLRKMLLAGLTPRIKIVETGLTWLEACDLEKQFILFYGRLDKGTGCLTNHTDGGEGSCGGIGNTLERSFDTRIKQASSASKRSSEVNAQAQATRMRAIECILGNKIIQKFESVGSTRKFGFNPGAISSVLAGRRHTHSGYGWRYSCEPT